VKKHRIPDLGSRILLYIKIGMKNKTNFFFCFFIVSGASFISKKIKEQGFLRKSHQKTYPLDPRSGIRKKFIPDPGGKKHRISDPGSGSATLLGTLGRQRKVDS
jgi:hypothetical protein